jgi:hypothetical protein
LIDGYRKQGLHTLQENLKSPQFFQDPCYATLRKRKQRETEAKKRAGNKERKQKERAKKRETKLVIQERKTLKRERLHLDMRFGNSKSFETVTASSSQFAIAINFFLFSRQRFWRSLFKVFLKNNIDS